MFLDVINFEVREMSKYIVMNMERGKGATKRSRALSKTTLKSSD